MKKYFLFIVISILLVIIIMFSGGCDQNEMLDSNLDYQEIVFTLYDSSEGDYELWLINRENAMLKRLTDNTIEDRSPVFSPNGSQIAFISKRDYYNETPYNAIYVMNADGTGQTKVSNIYYDIGGGLSSSSDCSELLFAAIVNVDDDYDIYKIEIKRGTEWNLTYTSTEYEKYPSWEPDGDRIVFVSDRNGNDDLFLMDSSGNIINCLTDADGNWHAQYPAWSPDGEKIVFIETFLQTTPSIIWYSNIVLLDVATGTINYLTEGTDYLKLYPTWTPDSAEISFVSNMSGNLNIYVVEDNGSNISQITDYNSPDWCEGHTWKP